MLLFLHPLCPCQREVLEGLLPLFLRLRVEQDKETWLPPQVVIPTCSESFFNCFALSHCFSEGFSTSENDKTNNCFIENSKKNLFNVFFPAVALVLY